MKPDFFSSSVVRRFVNPLAGAALLALACTGCKPHPYRVKLDAPQPPVEIWKEFSAANAMASAQKQVDFGPRPAGSDAIAQTRAYIVDELQKAGWDVTPQAFNDTTPRGTVAFVNLVARFNGAPDTTQTVLLTSHYDTKIFDTIRFVGADDGASSTAALLEMARVLALDPDLAWRVELVFFDGEEAVQQFTDTDGLYGSRHFAQDLQKTGRASQFKTCFLWDMIGDKDLTVTLSTDSPPDLAKLIFSSADALGVRSKFSYFESTVLDDHTPLNKIGIPSLDIIDFHYDYWHTADDTIDKISGESMQTVGQVTLYALRQMFPK
ncbi:MAG: M28 family peptidase [Chthoniobacteraceae bacterium]